MRQTIENIAHFSGRCRQSYGLVSKYEGLEVAEWLNSVGLTACVLKYRVLDPAQTGLIDAQRAMGLIWANAGK